MATYMLLSMGSHGHTSGIPVEEVGVIAVSLGLKLILWPPCRIGKNQECIGWVLQVVVNMVCRCCGVQ